MEQPLCRICIVPLIGLPAAGKSTFSHWLYKLPQMHFNIIHLCYDEHMRMPQNVDAVEINFKTQRLVIYKLLEEVVKSLKRTATVRDTLRKQLSIREATGSHDFLILCDDNNYYRSMRYKLYQFCRKEECAYAQVYIECDLAVALERNKARTAKEQVPKDVIVQMAARLETPCARKQQWEWNTLTLKSVTVNDFPTELILHFLKDSFVHIVPPMLADGEIQETTQSVVHQLDVLMRRKIGELLQNMNSNAVSKKAKASALNTRRKQILNEVKEVNFAEGFCAEDLNKYVNLLD